MTSNAAFKKRVRQLATQLNIPYAEARTRLQQAHDKPVFARSGVIIHPNPSAQPPTSFQTEASGKISLDRIEGANPRDRLPPYSADVCEALNRLALVAAIRRHPRLKSFFGTQVSSDTVYFAIDARKADREILAAVMYQAWLGNAKPAYDLADQWRAEIDPANGWHWNIARQFGEDPGDPPPPNREPRRRRPQPRQRTAKALRRPGAVAAGRGWRADPAGRGSAFLWSRLAAHRPLPLLRASTRARRLSRACPWGQCRPARLTLFSARGRSLGVLCPRSGD